MKQHDEEVGTKEDRALHRIQTAKDDAFRIFKDKVNTVEKSIQEYGYYSDVFCKPFLHKIAKSFCRLLHIHFVGNCKALADNYFASQAAIADHI